ncbi:MAG TPA: hypothetical protein VLT36_12050 [Candidatus Dormibacteraeota bacterium]|nr:hypothetical protein [Candidatus Dormibacteraeota bacterium]
MAFAVEEIPNEANLFRKVHPHFFNRETGMVSSAAFDKDDMSVNWEKYRSAEQSADEKSAVVVALLARDCRELEQTVIHTPIEPGEPFGPNQSHTEVCGKKNGSVKTRLKDKARIVWRRAG